MPTIVQVNSLADPRIADYANLRDAELRHREDPASPVMGSAGVFMAEGDLVVRRLLAAAPRYATRSILATPTRYDAIHDAAAHLPPQVPVYLAEPALLNAIVGFNMHRGLLALGAPAAAETVASVLAACHVVLVLEDLVNHDNIGGIFRNAAALGFGSAGVLLSPRCADPLYRKALRVSMGHVLTVPFARLAAWPSDLVTIREHGFRVVALSPEAGAVDLDEYARSSAGRPGRAALLLGTEGRGLSAVARRYSDIVIRIAMSPGVDSLNVGVAAAIALHRLAARSIPRGGAP